MNWRHALAALALFAAPAAGQVQSTADALTQDAAEWARVSGLPVDEAASQLQAQAETVPVTDAITVEFGDRLAGIVVEHHPYAIRVLLTGDTPVPDRRITVAGLDVPITFRVGAPATRARIVAAITAHQATIRAMLPHPPGLGADPREGAMIVMLNGSDLAAYAPGELEARLSTLTGVPVILRATDRADTDSAVEGGGHVDGISPVDGRRYACTTGFVVTDGARDGVVTAAHCPDDLAYLDADKARVPLDFVGQWGWSFQDVQLHLAAAPLDPQFYADTARTRLRPVTAARPRAATRAGDVVCHRGERTGYSCAEVVTTDFAPSGDLCGGPCAPTWVAVAGPTCKGGDSGGPVFDGTTALGIVKGASYRADGSCSFYYYMSVDYLPEGWSVLRALDPPRNGEGDQPKAGGGV